MSDKFHDVLLLKVPMNFDVPEAERRHDGSRVMGDDKQEAAEQSLERVLNLLKAA